MNVMRLRYLAFAAGLIGVASFALTCGALEI